MSQYFLQELTQSDIFMLSLQKDPHPNNPTSYMEPRGHLTV